MKKKINIPNYETKVPEQVRKDNAEKLNNYEREFESNEKSIAELS